MFDSLPQNRVQAEVFFVKFISQ